MEWILRPFVWFGILELITDRTLLPTFKILPAERQLEFLKVYNDLTQRWILLFTGVVALILLLVWIGISIIWDITSEEEPIHWFQRSGALAVFAGLFIEWRANQIIQKRPGIDCKIYTTTSKTWSFLDFLKHVGILYTLLGTLIWAYGDLVL